MGDFWETFPPPQYQETVDWWEAALTFGGIAVFVAGLYFAG